MPSVVDPNAIIKVTSKSFGKSPDLRRELLQAFPKAEFHDGAKGMTRDELADFLQGAHGVILALDPLDDRVLERCPNLKIIAKYGVGLDNLDVSACELRGIAVGWTEGVNTRSVSELALGGVLGLARNINPSSLALSTGQWVKDGGFQLTGKTVGVIGVGNIGRDLIMLLRPFDCRILGNDILDRSPFFNAHGVIATDKETIFKTADVITIHTPLTDLTHHLVNTKNLAFMKSTAIVVNTARGGIVDLQALKGALRGRSIGGAVIDVYESEPPDDLELLALPNLIATPHIGGNAREAVMAMGRTAIGHITDYFSKNPVGREFRP